MNKGDLGGSEFTTILLGDRGRQAPSVLTFHIVHTTIRAYRINESCLGTRVDQNARKLPMVLNWLFGPQLTRSIRGPRNDSVT